MTCSTKAVAQARNRTRYQIRAYDERGRLVAELPYKGDKKLPYEVAWQKAMAWREDGLGVQIRPPLPPCLARRASA